MRLSWLELRGFRSYDDLAWTPDPGVNVLVGANASGKTNLMEAVGYLATLRSFRGVADQVLINDRHDQAVLRGEIARGGSDVLVEVEIPAGGRRRAQVNRQRLSRVADMLGHVRSVVFLPDDLDMIKRGPAYRRDYLDATAVQIWPAAYADQQDYEKALRQRNALLRQSGREADPTTLSVWDQRLSQAGGMVMARRQAVLEALGDRIELVYNNLANASGALSNVVPPLGTPGTSTADASVADPSTGEEGGRPRREGDLSVVIDYRSTWGHVPGTGVGGSAAAAYAEQLLASLTEARKADMDRRVTTVGLHRDDPTVVLGGRDSRTRASQGEQRTLTLALRVASHQAIGEAVGEPPLLLLDDVFSELDRDRARALAGALPEAQTFITTARDEEVPVEGKRWTIADRTLA